MKTDRSQKWLIGVLLLSSLLGIASLIHCAANRCDQRVQQDIYDINFIKLI